MSSIHVLAESQWLQALGRFHVAIVHFPIALLLVAGAAELWRLLRGNRHPSPLALICLIVGGVSAIASSALGWIHKGHTGFGGTELQLHQWLGIGSAAAAVAAIVLLGLKDRTRALLSYRVAAIACALLVAGAGHFGGTLTHGDGYLTELVFAPRGEEDDAGPVKPQAAVMPVVFPTDGKIVFARDVEPIIQQACLDCHGPAKHRANLRMDTLEATLKGGEHGPALVAGKADESLIIQHILAQDGKRRMPMGREPLTDVQIRILKTWIDQGADWPTAASIASAQQKTHWAFVAPKRPELPPVSDPSWVRNDIDRFILAKLDKEGLKPSAEADKFTLIRRLSLDLIGLPPTPAEVDAFVADDSPGAYDRLVNRLLSSPQYGERWGRHWLDLARYADTNGYEKDQPRVIWPYRDWVINALNRDMTFDQFVIAQLAGDMLPGATDEDRIATGFHRNTMFNEEGGIDVEEFRYKAVVDRVQTTGTALLGLTVHCAQCHNHKYDDISHDEYFKFFALFNNADEPKMNMPDPSIVDQRRQAEERIAQLIKELPAKFPSRDESPRWEILTPDVFATTDKGSRLVLQPDDSLLATGDIPETDTYIIEAEANLDGVTAFRLEALTDKSLPRDGPGRKGGGRNKNGNFVLSQFHIEQAEIKNDDAGEKVESNRQRIKIDRAEADYSQKEYEVEKAIDDTIDKGWGVGGAKNANRHAIFHTPDKLEGRRKLIVTLKQLHKDHTLGKFRLSIGRPPPPPATQPAEEDRKKFLADNMARWEKETAARAANWIILDPSRFTRRHDATITKLDDKSLLFTGDNFYREEYKLEFDTDVKKITAIRIELLPHEELPKGGPGRKPDGGGLLSELTALAEQIKPTAPATQPATRPVEFASASASHGSDSVERAIDGAPDAHWDVPGGAELRTAVFKLKEPLVGFDGGTTLKLNLLQNQFSEISLGRLRVSITSDEDADEATGLPDEIERIILLPAKKRTAEQSARLKEHFLLVTPLLAAQQKEIADARAAMPQYVTTLVLKERSKPRVTRLHHRGEFLQPRDPITAPGVPAILPQLPKDQPANRLTLAKWLVSDENPLVARVVMNRIWSLYFGRGIVDSVEDFGVIGELPTHPEVLDYLATEFRQRNWSMKAMHRLIVTSATYRQSSRLTPGLRERDPQNVLYARGPRFRVEAEIVRDIALASSGLLSPRIGGPSVFPPQPPGISELSYGPLKWEESKGSDKYRRGMYTFLKRTAMYPQVPTFDGPSAEVVCARRVRSNTPLQALTTLNDIVYVEAAQALAKRVVDSVPADAAKRASEIFRLCVARPPDEVELRQICDFYDAQLKRLKDKSLDASAIALADAKGPRSQINELAAWTTVARSILNLDETVTKE